jgi:uncharacterized ferredoxin-like protein
MTVWLALAIVISVSFMEIDFIPKNARKGFREAGTLTVFPCVRLAGQIMEINAGKSEPSILGCPACGFQGISPNLKGRGKGGNNFFGGIFIGPRTKWRGWGLGKLSDFFRNFF